MLRKQEIDQVETDRSLASIGVKVGRRVSLEPNHGLDNPGHRRFIGNNHRLGTNQSPIIVYPIECSPVRLRFQNHIRDSIGSFSFP